MKKNKRILISLLLVIVMLTLTSSPVLSADVKEEPAAVTEQAGASITSDAVSSDVKEEVVALNVYSLNKSECMIAEYVNTEEFNKASHVKRLNDEEELDTYVFLNSDGTKSVYYMDENVKFIDKNGDVKEKDVSLVKKTDGFGIVRNEFDLHIPVSASSGISMSYNGYDVKLIPQTSVRAVPARQNGDTVVYDGFFGTNTSLVYTPMLSGVKEDVIMKAYIPNAEFRFVLETDGLGLYLGKDGYYLAESETSEAVLSLGNVIIYDAVGKPDYGTMTVTTVTEGQKYILALSAPEEFLTDPTTVYPVTIDPTLTVSDTATGDGAIEDTVLFSGRPTKNYGDYKYLSIGYVDSTYGVGKVAVKLPGLYNSVEYLNTHYSDITSVKFYCQDSSGNSAQYVNLHPITGPLWDENTVTYGDSVTYSTTYNWGTSMSSGTWTSFDITVLIQAWKNAVYSSARGFILINSNESSASYKKAPYSSEYTGTALRPYVMMTYNSSQAPIEDGVYYLNSWKSSKYLNNIAGSLNGVSGTINSIGSTIEWQFIYKGSNKYLIRSATSPYYYLAASTSATSNSIYLLSMATIQDRYLWTVTRDTTYSNRIRITNCFGNALYSHFETDSTTVANINVTTEVTNDYEWRFEKTSDFSELTTFSCNTTTAECFKKKQFRVTADATNNSFVEAKDFEYSLYSGSYYLTLTPSGAFSNIKGKNVGTAVIEITYKVTNTTRRFTITVNPYPFIIGMSTDSYTGGCGHDSLGSYMYAGSFYNNLNINDTRYNKSDIWPYWNYNTDNITTASKSDFSRVGYPYGDISKQADFMVYMGHGLDATHEKNYNARSKGNFLHYNYTSDGVGHSGSKSDCVGDDFNLYTSEARFTNPRWVWLYTCNFLTINDYVDDNELKEMMNGTHIILGYASKATLANTVAERFASELTNERKVIDAFFVAGDQEESKLPLSYHTQKVLYVTAARNETIYSEPVDYTYSSSDISTLENHTHFDLVWE